MSNTCETPIKGRVYRIVKVDACGVPVTGTPSLVVVNKSFVQVQMTPQYEDGTEFFNRTADGSACVNQLDPPIFKRHQLTIDLCAINIWAIAQVLGARVLGTGTPVTGATGFALAEGPTANKFSLEVWQEVGGAGACDPTGLQRFVYHAWPHCGNGRIGQYTVENDVSQLQLQATTFAPSTLWGDGPGSGTSWLPVGMTVAALEHWLFNVTTNQPPASVCNEATLT